MDVQPAARDVVKRPNACLDEVGDPSHDAERDEEPERGQEQALPPLALKMETVDPLEGAHATRASAPQAPGRLGREDARNIPSMTTTQPARDLLWRALRASSSSRMVKSVRGRAWMCPWKASVQCSGGHLRT